MRGAEQRGVRWPTANEPATTQPVCLLGPESERDGRAVELTDLVTSIDGLSPVSAAAILAETV